MNLNHLLREIDTTDLDSVCVGFLPPTDQFHRTLRMSARYRGHLFGCNCVIESGRTGHDEYVLTAVRALADRLRECATELNPPPLLSPQDAWFTMGLDTDSSELVTIELTRRYSSVRYRPYKLASFDWKREGF